MTEAKQRIGLVRQLHDRTLTTTRHEFDIELACLHLRRILELIAFSSLAANKTAYAEHHADFPDNWKARTILQRLQHLNPDFFPVPVSGLDAHHLAPVEDVPFLSREDFSTLYDLTSKVLHTRNPYKPGPRTINLIRTVESWAQLIWQLLSVHMVRIAGSEKRLLVQMHHPSDGEVHVFVIEPT